MMGGRSATGDGDWVLPPSRTAIGRRGEGAALPSVVGGSTSRPDLPGQGHRRAKSTRSGGGWAMRGDVGCTAGVEELGKGTPAMERKEIPTGS